MPNKTKSTLFYIPLWLIELTLPYAKYFCYPKSSIENLDCIRSRYAKGVVQYCFMCTCMSKLCKLVQDKLELWLGYYLEDNLDKLTVDEDPHCEVCTCCSYEKNLLNRVRFKIHRCAF